MTRFLCLVMALLLTACGGHSGGSGSPGAGPDGPTGLQVSLGQSPTILHFTWTRPSQAFDGYQFEGKVGSGAYSKLNQTLIPNTWTEAYLNLNGDAAELETRTFRMWVMRGTSASPASNEASIRMPLNTPSINAYLGQGGITVSWSNNSAVADTLKLERGVVNASATTWTTIPSVTFGTTSWIDGSAPEGASYTYRVTYSKAQDSASATSYAVSTPMAAPGQPAATPLVEGVRLNWTNPSQAATEVAVMRASGLDNYPSYQQVALVPAGTTSYTDQPLATGYYTYRLENRKTGTSSTYSQPVQVVTLPPQNGLSISPTILGLPQADTLRRTSQGAWVLSAPYQYNIQVREPAGSNWATYSPSSAQSWSAPYFLLDSHDQPHLVYTRQVTQGTSEVALMHAWRQGAAWQTEEVARRALYSSTGTNGFTFALDASDRMHLVWLKTGGTAADLEYAIKGTDGTWIIESPVNFTTQSSLGTYKLVVDPTGQPHLFIGAWQEIYHLTRSSGTWTKESIPATGFSVGWYDYMGCSASAPDTYAVLMMRSHQPYDGKSDLVMLRKQAGTWQPGEVVFASDAYSSSFQGTLVPNKIGSKLALYHPSSSGGVLRVWSAGAWTSTVVGPNASGTPTLGFDSADKIYLLLPAGWGGSSDHYPYVLYTETP
ncbi:MAG: hypothetical protein HY014_17045 [Acidobacteria bacterium]|nr:hypothetical protein [Acidobacteriota bacterium]MBI3489840.1 hypothetical protein [Acidobacteriota bacterium]